MGVGAWGYGTGATSAAAHRFSLTIQGIDVIATVPMESVSVSASVSSNATLSFAIWDEDSTIAIPTGWSDVLFTEWTGDTADPFAFDAASFDTGSFDATASGTPAGPTAEVIFSGVVMGVEVKAVATGRWLAVRCVDYGVLLDVTPTISDLTLSGYFGDTAAQVAASAPLGGIMALARTTYGPGRLVSNSGSNSYSSTATTSSAWRSVRSALDGLLDGARVYNGRWHTYTGFAGAVWVTPLRQLAVHPLDYTFGDAPLEVRQNPTTAGHVAAEEITSDLDYRELEVGVYVQDADVTSSDGSGFYRGTVNGYTVAPGSVSVDIPTYDPGPPAVVPPPPYARATHVEFQGNIYVDQHGTANSGEATVVSSSNFTPAQDLTVYYPNVGLDGTFPISAVSVRFLGGTLRRTTIQFAAASTSPSGTRGTVARWNRKRFARAGITT